MTFAVDDDVNDNDHEGYEGCNGFLGVMFHRLIHIVQSNVKLESRSHSHCTVTARSVSIPTFVFTGF